MRPLPPATKAILIANVVVYLLQMATANAIVGPFALWPFGTSSVLGTSSGVGFNLWQLVTYSFLHANFFHLFFNMFAVYMFGGEIERLFGTRRFVAFWFAAVITAAITQLLVSGVASGTPYPTIGASGGVFGLLLAFGMFFPRRMLLLIFPPIPMPAWLFVTLYGAIELYLGVTGSQAGVAHFAHLGGMLGGYLMIRQWRRSRVT